MQQQHPFELLKNRLMPRLHAERRVGPATAVSLGLHIFLIVFLLYALQVPAALREAFTTPGTPAQPEERLRFVTVEPSAPTAPTARPAETPRQPRASVPPVPASRPLTPPREVPSTLPPPKSEAVAPPSSTGITGPIGGGAGITRGVQPSMADPRVWVEDPALVYAPKTSLERLDSAMTTALNRYRDSLDANAYSPNRFERGDWTIERGGQKWGIDQQAIRLGPLSIPTALLALLPLNRMQANPIAMERDRTMAAMRADIIYHANARMNEEQFRKAVKAIRERKERERRDAARNPGPVRSPGDRPPQ
ncbi:MAG TPA: hypothetical protein VF178_15680 [Gemmatimonadaceae bacterium]